MIKRKSPLRIKKSAPKKTKSVGLMTQMVAANAKTNLLKLNVNLTNTKKSPKTRTIKKLNPLRKTKRTSAV